MKKFVVFVLATSFLATSATAGKPSQEWQFCKSLFGAPVCKIFR